MLAEPVQTALNKQLNEEIYASHLYLSLSAFLDAQDLRGMAAWMRAQWSEEQKHMMRFYRMLGDSKPQTSASS